MKRMIKAAEATSVEDKFDEHLDQIEDDFSYLMDGLRHISGSGDYQSANAIADKIDAAIQACISDTADAIAE